MFPRSFAAPLLLWAACLLAAPSAHAFRPFVTEDAGVAGHRKLEIETGWDFSRVSGGSQNAFLLSTVYGATQRLELSADVPMMLVEQPGGPVTGGMGDLAFNGKFVALEQQGRRPQLAGRLHWKTDYADHTRALGTGDHDLGLAGIASRFWGAHSAHFMTGFNVAGRSANPALRDTVFYGLGGNVALHPRWSALAELFGSSRLTDGAGSAPMSLRFGTIFTRSKSLQLDASLRLGVTDAAPRWGLSFGMTVGL